MGYNPRKAAQTIAHFILRNKKQDLDILKIVKLVYLADRECIKTYGFPIQDEDRVSMQRGPVNLNTYNHIKNPSAMKDSDYTDFLKSRIKDSVRLSADTIVEDDLDELSEAEVEVLDNVWLEFGDKSGEELVAWTHDKNNVPEWDKPKGLSQPIPLLSIMKHVGLPNAEEHVAEVEAFSRMDDMWKELGARAEARRDS